MNAKSKSDARPLYTIVIHGGAGTILKANMTPEKEAAYTNALNAALDIGEAVLKNGEHESGMTIHYVDEGVDTGEIILQKRCPVLPKDNVESLKQRVQALEKKWYPEVIRRLSLTD